MTDTNACSVKTIDGAVVGSLHFELTVEDISAAEQCIAAELRAAQEAIERQGGMVGHAKASLERKQLSKISVIDAQTSIDRVESRTVTGEIAIIAFFIEEDFMTQILQNLLRSACKS